MAPTAAENLDKWLDKSDPKFPQDWQRKYETQNYTHKQLQTKNRRHSEKETEAIGNFATNFLNPIGRGKADRELHRRQNKRVATDRMLKEQGLQKERSAYNESAAFFKGTTKLFEKLFK